LPKEAASEYNPVDETGLITGVPVHLINNYTQQENGTTANEKPDTVVEHQEGSVIVRIRSNASSVCSNPETSDLNTSGFYNILQPSIDKVSTSGGSY